MNNVIIIGAGEIGQSIRNVLYGEYPTIRDVESSVQGHFNFMHICFPCTEADDFIKAVSEYCSLYAPDTIVVHSTVPPGTIKKLPTNTAHVPINGKHPDLVEDIIHTYPLWVSGNSNEAVAKTTSLFRKYVDKVNPLFDTPPETTELAKIMCTTYYGWNILFEKIMYELCQEYNVNFDIVYTAWNKAYNEGMIKRGTPEYCRPVLKHIPGPIGKHCVVPNCKLFIRYCSKKFKWLFEKIIGAN